jgi:hypothetical protein
MTFIFGLSITNALGIVVYRMYKYNNINITHISGSLITGKIFSSVVFHTVDFIQACTFKIVLLTVQGHNKIRKEILGIDFKLLTRLEAE